MFTSNFQLHIITSLGGFVGLFLGLSFYNLFLMILESIEKASKKKNENDDARKEEGDKQFDGSLRKKSINDS